MTKIFVLIFSFFILCSCSTKYQKASRLIIYGYAENELSDNSYEITYKVNYETTLKKCLDMALMRASELALKNNQNFELKKVEIYRNYQKNFKQPKPLYLATGIGVTSGAAFGTMGGAQGGAIGEKYAKDRMGNASLIINLKNLNDGKTVNACDLCNLIYSKYDNEVFKKDPCECQSTEQGLKKAEIFIEKQYSNQDVFHFNRKFGSINVFNPNGDISAEIANKH